MTDTAHSPTPDELEDVFRPADRPPSHHRSVCVCADPETIIVDLTWGSGLSPQRTETACNKVTAAGLCTCTEFIPGRTFGRDPKPSCGNCHDTADSHKQRTSNKKAARR